MLREIVDKADAGAVEGFRKSVQQAGNSTSDGKGMWADSEFADLVQYNDGFKTQLIGTPEQIAERIVEYKKIGVNLFLTCYLHFQEEVAAFGRDILPIVRELEADLARKNGTELVPTRPLTSQARPGNPAGVGPSSTPVAAEAVAV